MRFKIEDLQNGNLALSLGNGNGTVAAQIREAINEFLPVGEGDKFATIVKGINVEGLDKDYTSRSMRVRQSLRGSIKRGEYELMKADNRLFLLHHHNGTLVKESEVAEVEELEALETARS